MIIARLVESSGPACCYIGLRGMPFAFEDLDAFLAIAEDLQLKGLSGAEQGLKNFDQPSRTESNFKEKTNAKIWVALLVFLI